MDVPPRGIPQGHGPAAVTRARAVLLTRIGVLVGAVLLLEMLCRFGVINPLSVIPPSQMAEAMLDLITSGTMTDPATQTFLTVVSAFLIAVALGVVTGAIVHAIPRIRRAIDPVLASYYSVPTFIFYPLLVALLGLNMMPLIVLGVMSAAPAVVISTLAGLDHVPPVLRRVARTQRLDRARTLWLIILPAAMPNLFGGFKLALTYALIGVIAGEFILSGDGLGYAISFAYQSFDNRTMYGLMLFVLLVAVTANGALYVWEGRLAQRRARA
jgi:NitT/TauT family transport system permease protein